MWNKEKGEISISESDHLYLQSRNQRNKQASKRRRYECKYLYCLLSDINFLRLKFFTQETSLESIIIYFAQEIRVDDDDDVVSLCFFCAVYGPIVFFLRVENFPKVFAH